MISETKQNVSKFLWMKVKHLRITQRQIARMFHTDQPKVVQKFRTGDFTLEELLMLFAITGSTKDEIGEVMYEQDYGYRV